ncbi:hypothetical protein K1719_047409, partial [Acacia pycnantha]
VQINHSKMGKMNGMGVGSNRVVNSRKDQGSRGVQVEKKVAEVRKEKLLSVRINEVSKNKEHDDNQKIAHVSTIPESNMEMYKWKEVNMTEKENLHPGEVGAASKSFASVLKELRYRYNVDIVVILEHRISGSPATKIIKSWGFTFSRRVEAVGFSGGIWVLWNREELCVDVLVKEEQFLYCRLNLNGKEMLFTAVYASPCEQKRQQVWSMLYGLAMEIHEPWLVAGDFNEIKSPMEQRGGRGANETRCRVFNEWIQDCNLVDMETKGPFFTWKGPKWDGLDRVFKRLDRCLCNVSWLEMFEDAEVRVIPRVGSDYHPVLVKLRREDIRVGTRNFRYEVAWQMHNEFQEFMSAVWQEGVNFNELLNSVQHSLKI